MKRIALVDDDASIRLAMSMFLQMRGYAVETFETGELFLLRAPTAFDCILLDLEMPGMNGLSVLKALDRLEAVPPVLILSGGGAESVARAAMELGALALLEKPAKPSELLAALVSAFDTQSLLSGYRSGNTARAKAGGSERERLQNGNDMADGGRNDTIERPIGS